MHTEVACPAPSGEPILTIDSIPFPEIPGTTNLFSQYQTDPAELRNFYPSAVQSHTAIANRLAEVLQNHTADRGLLCDALEDMNRKFGAPAKTLENIELLREADTVAVVSGQQAGLFTGPLYTIYKALSAIKMTECLRGRGIKAVPVFWVATEDHDFEEVSKTFVLDRNGEVEELKNEPKRCKEDLPVGWVKLDDSIRQTVDELFEELVPTEFTEELRQLIEQAWAPNAYFGDAFGRMLTSLLGKYGLIMLCPLDSRLKTLAGPIYVEAIKRRDELVDALRNRSEELVASGYPAQVLIGEDYFPLFWQSREGTRHALKKGENRKIHTKDGSREFTIEELIDLAEREPGRFSPSVVLRSVVQDHLLPTACYFGGAAEVAYFAQSGEVYRLLGRPATPIIHRQSFSIIESRHRKTLERYEIEFTELFGGIEPILTKIVDEHLHKDTAMLIAQVEEKINIELNRLDQKLSQIDPTLADNLATRRRKIIYHIGAIRNKFHHSQYRRDTTFRRQIESLFSSLLPHHHLQERSLNVSYFLNRYGTGFIDWLYNSVDLDDKGHRIAYL
ncbi:MAG: bacillithiol biosynthesis cysteine-adding enzyme BshC [Pyrinomonadaceae bacterium]|nr:bacillithiol biosynthesis cysteine-adding enzyme BshC [Pyrinomonadaceae bacterium]